MRKNVKHNFTIFIFSSVFIMIVFLLTGAVANTGGGCLGTQSQVHGVSGSSSSGYFNLLAPSDNNVTTLQPTFSWSRYPADLTSYTLQISTNINFGTYVYTRTNIAPSTTSYPSGTGTYPITLNSNTDYYWRVIVVDSDTGIQTLASNAPFKFSTGIVPGTFTLLSPSNNSTGITTTPTLTWTPSSQALNYIVQIDTKTTFNKPLTYDTSSDEQLVSILTTSHTIPTEGILISGGVRYYWRIIAQNTGGTQIAPSGTTGYWSFTTQ